MTTVNSSIIYRSVTTLANVTVNVTKVTTVVGGGDVISLVTPSAIYRSMVGGGSGGGGTVTYTNPAAVPVTVGGITAGTTFASAQTMQQMWDALLYPYQSPAFTSFSLSGVSSTVEVGYTLGAPVTFLWATSNSGNVNTNSINLTDVTLSTILLSGTANDGTQAVTLPASIQNVVAASHTFGINGTNTQSSTFSRNATISWQWRLHYGTNTNPTLTGSDISALASSNLATGYAGTYSYAAGGYKYISFANAAGGQINLVRDQLTGFNVPLATVTDNAAYSNVDGGGSSYALVSHTNANGVTTNYRVYRTTNSLGGSVTLVVT